jgi:hypothetical protein
MNYSLPTAVCSHCSDVCFGNGLHVGYATDRQNNVFCFRCCATQDVDQMLRTGAIVLYLDNKGISNWSGALRFPLYGSYSRSKRGGGFGSQRTDAWFVGPDGYIWHAINRGDMQLARCRRTRDKLTPRGVVRQRKIYGFN